VASASATSTAPATGTAPAASTAPALPVVAFLGDDYTGGVGATSPARRWSSLVAGDFGWTEKNFGFGGTGYSTGGRLAGGTPYSARITALVSTEPSIVIVSGGRYDIQSTNGPTQIKTGVTATFTALRAALPHATIVAESPLWSSTKPPATLALVVADVKAAVAAVGGRYLDIGQPLVGAPADLASNPALPNDAGYAALAKAFETAYRT
jgi:lysophospholipase L1-like esterase